MNYLVCPSCTKSYAYRSAWLLPCCGKNICFSCAINLFEDLIYDKNQIRLAKKQRCMECESGVSKLYYNYTLTEFARCYYLNFLQLPTQLAVPPPLRHLVTLPENDLEIFNVDHYTLKYTEKLARAVQSLKSLKLNSTVLDKFLYSYIDTLFARVEQFTKLRQNNLLTGISPETCLDLLERTPHYRKSLAALLVANLLPPPDSCAVRGTCSIDWGSVFAVFDTDYKSIDLYRFILLVGPRARFDFRLRSDQLVTIHINKDLKFITHYSALVIINSEPEAKRLYEIEAAIARRASDGAESMGDDDDSNSGSVVMVSGDSDEDSEPDVEDDESDVEDSGSAESESVLRDESMGVCVRKLSDHMVLLYSVALGSPRSTLNITYETPQTLSMGPVDVQCEKNLAASLDKFIKIL